MPPLVLTSPDPPGTWDLIRGTPSPTAPRTSIVQPLWCAPSLASAGTHNHGPQKPLPVTLHESPGQRSAVASGLHDNSLAVPRIFHPTTHTHTHINSRKQLLSPHSCASKESPEVEIQSKHLHPNRSNTLWWSTVLQTTAAARWQEINDRKCTLTQEKVPDRTKPWLYSDINWVTQLKSPPIIFFRCGPQRAFFSFQHRSQ